MRCGRSSLLLLFSSHHLHFVVLLVLLLSSQFVSSRSSTTACEHVLNDAEDAAFRWRLRNSNGTIDIPSRTAGRSVHLDLLHARIIDDPDIGLNEGTTRWVAEEPHWTYTTRLDALSLQRQNETLKFLLHFESIDTRAAISFGDPLRSFSFHDSPLQTNNAHRRWTFDVTEYLHTRPEALSVRLYSPIKYAAEEAKQEPRYPTQNDVPGAPASQQYEYPFRNFIRKPSSDLGWDWGPAYAPSGFGRATLSQFGGHCHREGQVQRKDLAGTALARTAKSETLYLIDTAIDIHLHQEHWELQPAMQIFSARPTSIDGAILRITTDGIVTNCSSMILPRIVPALNDRVITTSSCLIPKTQIKPWWPRGVRLPDTSDISQQLYNIQFQLLCPDGETLHWEVRTGFRKIVLDQHVYTANEIASGVTPGSAFNFKINDHPQALLILGSNLVPFSTLPLSPEEERRVVDYTLQAVVASGQNMVRVWGGGQYGSDYLYQRADELGILIWSEFAFACSLYPTYPDFLDNVKQEAKEQVRRISRFASHALWAGNNEGELNMLPVAATYANGSIYKDQYELLFNDVLWDIVRIEHPSSAYIPSSTTTGGTFVQGKYVPRYQNFTAGEIHGDGEHYNYNASEAMNTDTYARSRFVNEFGMHSMADIRSLDTIATAPNDYSFNSTVARSRSKHSPPGNLTYPWPASDGQAQMTAGVASFFPVPMRPPAARQGLDQVEQSTGGDRSLLAQWSYATQCFQALFIGNQIGFYRLRTDAPERNTGSLYWQLNSVWKAATDWASLEVDGRWKVLHYIVARMHADTIAYLHHNVTSNVVGVHAVSRSWMKSSGTVRVSWYDWDGRLVDRIQVLYHLGPTSSALLANFSVGAESKYRDKWMHAQLSPDEQDKTAEGAQNEQFLSPTSLGSVALRPARVVLRQCGPETGRLPSPVHANNQLSEQERFTMQHFHGSDREEQREKESSPRMFNFEVANVGEGVAPWVVVSHSARLRGWFVHAERDEPSNAFWLRPGESRVLRFRCFDRTSCPDDVGLHDLAVTSMWESVDVPT